MYWLWYQGTKKFRSDSPGLVDFVVGLVDFILHLPDGQVKFSGKFLSEINWQEHCKTWKIFGLVEMTSGLVYLGYSLPEGQAGKLNFFVPWVHLFQKSSHFKLYFIAFLSCIYRFFNLHLSINEQFFTEGEVTIFEWSRDEVKGIIQQ